MKILFNFHLQAALLPCEHQNDNISPKSMQKHIKNPKKMMPSMRIELISEDHYN